MTNSNNVLTQHITQTEASLNDNLYSSPNESKEYAIEDIITASLSTLFITFIAYVIEEIIKDPSLIIKQLCTQIDIDFTNAATGNNLPFPEIYTTLNNSCPLEYKAPFCDAKTHIAIDPVLCEEKIIYDHLCFFYGPYDFA